MTSSGNWKSEEPRSIATSRQKEIENPGRRTTEENAIPVKLAQIANIGEVSGNFDALNRKQRRLHGQIPVSGL